MSELRKIEQLATKIYCEKYPVDHFNFKYWERMRDNFVKGYVEGYYETVQNLLDLLDDETIAERIGLSLEVVQQLRLNASEEK